MEKNKEFNWIITDDFGDKSGVALIVQLKGWDYSAYIKWDGCCEITRKNDCIDEQGKSIDNTFHICDVPQFIKVLKSLEEFRMKNIDGAE